MPVVKLKNKLSGQRRFIVIIFLLLASLMISSAVIELQQSKQELYQLMTRQAKALLESLVIASKNTLQASSYLDNIAEQRLLNNAALVRRMYENRRISNAILSDISSQNDIYRINIFNRQGRKIYSSHKQEHFGIPEKFNPQDILQPIFNGESDTLRLGYRAARFEEGQRFIVALAAEDRSAIVLNVEASAMLHFKKDIDFGSLIRNVVNESPDIIYIALQDTANILAASGNVRQLDEVMQSQFLRQAYFNSIFATRTATFETGDIFEAVHSFSIAAEPVGLFRLGLSLAPLEDINERIYRRLIIITIILVGIGFVLFVYIFTRQRLTILQKQYDVVETYSGNIIDNVSDAIIVFNNADGIKIFNDAAEKLFLKSKENIMGGDLDKLFSAQECRLLLKEETVIKQINCSIDHTLKQLLVSKSNFKDDQENENTILVIRDLTEQKMMEAQIERQQRLTAMGELASGVAHEIRNPLNTIGTIVQQLDKDFEPVNEKEEYHELAGLVYNEVKRINETIQDFLRFARPEPLHPSPFPLDELFSELEKQYAALLKSKKIKLVTSLQWKGSVNWDRKQIKQVFVNLIQNAVEAIENNGRISITSSAKADNNLLDIKVEDDGPGMAEDIRNNIFNLYYTTKAKGTGIGLSIVQRIIYEHNGMISVESRVGKGTVFTLRLPRLK
jgi:two-component system, NtrC family, sensor histidine kinase HydH